MGERKKKSPNWSESEINSFLDIMIENHVMDLFDDKKTRTSDIYKMISEKFNEKGFARTPEQLKIKFQTMKSEFIKQRNNNNTSGHSREESPIYDRMNMLLSKRPVLVFQTNGYDSSETALNDSESQSTVTSGPSSPQQVNTPASIDSVDSVEILGTESTDNTPRAKRNRTSYRSVVNSVTNELQKTITENTEKTLDALKKLQEEDKNFLLEMQRSDQQFMLNLFSAAQGVQYHMVNSDTPADQGV